MSIGIVSDSEFEKAFSKKAPVQVEIVDKPSKGRESGDNNVPDSLRKIIGETAVIDGRKAALQLAKQFDISPSSVSAYANGATSTTTYDTPSKSILSHIQKSRLRAVGKAQKTLNSALSAITQSKLDYSDAKDLSGIAKDMSVVIKNLEPQKLNEVDGTSTKQFVIFAPTFKDERSYDSIVVNE